MFKTKYETMSELPITIYRRHASILFAGRNAAAEYFDFADADGCFWRTGNPRFQPAIGSNKFAAPDTAGKLAAESITAGFKIYAAREKIERDRGGISDGFFGGFVSFSDRFRRVALSERRRVGQ